MQWNRISYLLLTRDILGGYDTERTSFITDQENIWPQIQESKALALALGHESVLTIELEI